MSSSSSSSSSSSTTRKADVMEVDNKPENDHPQQDESTMDETEKAKKIDAEYKIWKKNSPFLYDLVVTHALEWPSLTVDWLKKTRSLDDKSCTDNELVLGTHTDGAQNHVMVTTVRLPNEDTEISVRKYDEERGELGSYGGVQSKIENKVRINHDGEVHRARHMPQDDYVIGTKNINGEIHVFHVRLHESSTAEGPSRPNVRCVGHEKEGYGLDWSPFHTGHLLSGSDDGLVCVWDAKNPAGEVLEPLHKFKAHDSVVGDVAWHRYHKDIFASVGDDARLNIWDLRSLEKSKDSIVAHEKEVQCLSFSPFNEYLMLTGGTDNAVKLWDLRKTSQVVHTFAAHTDEVYQVAWAPFDQSIMASCSADRRVMIWDLSRIGAEQDAEDAEDGPPELMFIHGGHTAKVSDFSWNLNNPWVIASVSEDNILQVWQVAENICNESDDGANLAEAKVKDSDLE